MLASRLCRNRLYQPDSSILITLIDWIRDWMFKLYICPYRNRICATITRTKKILDTWLLIAAAYYWVQITTFVLTFRMNTWYWYELANLNSRTVDTHNTNNITQKNRPNIVWKICQMCDAHHSYSWKVSETCICIYSLGNTSDKYMVSLKQHVISVPIASNKIYSFCTSNSRQNTQMWTQSNWLSIILSKPYKHIQYLTLTLPILYLIRIV